MTGILALSLFGAFVCAIVYVAIEAARLLTDFGDDE
jgi:hypothetical protein